MSIQNSALILVDCENDFLSDNGKLFSAVKPSLESNNVISNLNTILDASHEAGIPVIFTSMVFEPGYPEIGEEPYGIMTAIRDSGAFIKGTWGAEIAEALHFDSEDTVIEKSQMCAFKKTNLKQLLEQQGIKTLFFGGLVTDLCLETSIRSAYDQGFEAYALTDCMAALNPDVHESTVVENFPLFSKPILHDDYLQKISALKNTA